MHPVWRPHLSYSSIMTIPVMKEPAAFVRRFILFLIIGALVLGSSSAQAYVSSDTPAAPGLFRPLIFIALIFLPGAWLGFMPPARKLGAGLQICLSIALSPLMLFAQFYALRFAGLPVSALPLVLILINAPAGYYIYKARRQFTAPDTKTFVSVLAVLALPLGFLAFSFHDEAVVILRAHNWLHADLVYQFLAGKLLPEEMALAGSVTAYPWAGHVYQSILSLTLHVAPSSSFALTNIVWLLTLFGFAALIAKEFGGGRIAQITAPVWAAFAVNPVGLGIRQTASSLGVGEILPWDVLAPFFGDPRYGTFLQKYYNFNQMPFAFTLLAALLYLAIVERPGFNSKTRGVLMGLVLLSLLIIYPVFLPVGCGVVFARIVAVWFTPEAKIRAKRQSEAIALFIAMAAAVALAFPYYEIVLQDRVGGGGPRLDFSLYQIKKISHTGFALILPAAALALVAWRMWPKMQTALLVVGLTAIGLIALHIFVHIPNWRGEYKFVMAASVVLTPFIGVAIEPWFEALRKKGAAMAIVALAAASIAIATPGFVSLITHYGGDPGRKPDLVVDGLDLKYAPSEPLAGALDAIRTKSPPSSLIVFSQTELYLPTIARRTAFTPYDQFEKLAGISMRINYVLFNIKGYARKKNSGRVASVTNLYQGADSDARAEALGEILALARPVAIIINRSKEQALEAWLGSIDGAAAIHEDENHAVWLVYPHELNFAG